MKLWKNNKIVHEQFPPISPGEGSFEESVSLNSTAAAYDAAAQTYTGYASGDGAENLWAFLTPSGEHAYSHSDRVLWDCLRGRLDSIPNEQSIRILDAGAGDGIWALRIAEYLAARKRRYEITAVDVSSEMLNEAERQKSIWEKKYSAQLQVRFAPCNLEEPLPFDANQFDLTFALYTVLNHIDRNKLPVTIHEIMRVTRDLAVCVIKTPDGSPTAFTTQFENVTEFAYDMGKVTFRDRSGNLQKVNATLLTVPELSELFESQGGKIVDKFGIDIFVSPLVGKSRMSKAQQIVGEPFVMEDIASWESDLCRMPSALDFANHVALVVESCGNDWTRSNGL